MKRKILQLSVVACLLTASATSCCNRCVRTAEDITPGNPYGEKLDWRYGAGDIKIQTTKITSQLMDRWYAKAGINGSYSARPRIVITEIENLTDTYISTEMVRDIIEGVAINDGRFTILVGDSADEKELDSLMSKIRNDPKYKNSSQLQANQAIAPQFLGKIRITKAVNSDNRFDYEDYRMTITLYDIETQQAIDSAWDVLRKKVKA